MNTNSQDPSINLEKLPITDTEVTPEFALLITTAAQLLPTVISKSTPGISKGNLMRQSLYWAKDLITEGRVFQAREKAETNDLR